MAAPSDRQRTIGFFKRWGVSYDEMAASFHDTFAPDCLWEQRPLAVTRGPAEAVQFLHRARIAMGIETVEVDLRNITASRGIVFTERIDHLRRADGGLIVSAPVAGVLEWEDGKLVAWREYFDAASFAGRALPGLVAGTARRVAAWRPSSR